MLRLRALAIVALCFGFTPGLAEIVSDGWHAAVAGHTHHATDHRNHAEHAGQAEHAEHAEHAQHAEHDASGDEHHVPGPEHGCTGWQHTCGCHSSLSIAATVLESMVAAPASIQLAPTQSPSGIGPTGVQDELDRPPRA